MSTKKLSRNLLFALLLGAGVTVVIMAMFYGQYRWLSGQIIRTSETEHKIFLRKSFERRVRSQLHVIADDFDAAIDQGDPQQVRSELNRILARYDVIIGLQYQNDNGTLRAGNFPDVDATTSADWLQQSLVMAYPVGESEQPKGMIAGAFMLERLHAEFAGFSEQLAETQRERSMLSYLWIGSGTLAMLLVCGFVVTVVARDHARRVGQLQEQAEKLRDADFGDPLPENRDDDLGRLAAVFNSMRDRLRATTMSRDYVDSILSGMSDAIIVTSSDGNIRRINKATTELLGYEESELIGNSIDYIVDNNKSASLLDSTPGGLPQDAFFESKFGESIPVSFTSSHLDGKQEFSGDRIFAAQNTTERRRAEQRIRYLARIDALTKIPNRMQFQHLLQRAIARARRSNRPLCLFYVDVDHFKEINDTFGHLAGDTTLETVAERMTANLPENSVIGRLAGDEFTVIVDGYGPDEDGKQKTDELASKVLKALSEPFMVHGHEVFMTASMGIAYYPDDAANVIDLIRNADAALYTSKKAGGNTHSYYVPEMNEAAVERLMTKSKLKRAFERDELRVHYQPKYNMETGEVFGAEALVRWELPDRGLILPSDFIPIAEENNLIIEIGEWVLDKVCEDFRYWQRSVSSPGRVSVNMSLRQLRQRSFTRRIDAIMRGHEVSPTSLELEITETTLMENTEQTIRLLDELYALGLHMAIDDFGTGYSSLSALQQFPISTLKIDKSFVRDIPTNPEDATLVETIVAMGHNLNMDVVAEGVENEAQLNFLRDIRCTYAQGLLFGDPMSSDDYLDLLLKQMNGTDQYRALFG